MLFVPFTNWVPFDENDGLSLLISNGLRSKSRTLDKCFLSRIEVKDS